MTFFPDKKIHTKTSKRAKYSLHSLVKPKYYSSGFTLMEILIVIVIIGILATLGLGSFQSSQQKGRDAKRKSELKQIGTALEAYFNDYGQYPVGISGEIGGCSGGTACSWGESFEDDSGTVYMVELPVDPRENYEFFYDSSGTEYQVYTRLENTFDRDINVDSEDDPLVYDGVSCGDLECNYGVSSGNTTPESGRTLVEE